MPVAQLIANPLNSLLAKRLATTVELVPVLSVAGLFLLCVVCRNLSAPRLSTLWVGLSNSR